MHRARVWSHPCSWFLLSEHMVLLLMLVSLALHVLGSSTRPAFHHGFLTRSRLELDVGSPVRDGPGVVRCTHTPVPLCELPAASSSPPCKLPTAYTQDDGLARQRAKLPALSLALSARLGPAPGVRTPVVLSASSFTITELSKLSSPIPVASSPHASTAYS